MPWRPCSTTAEDRNTYDLTNGVGFPIRWRPYSTTAEDRNYERRLSQAGANQWRPCSTTAEDRNL